MTQTPTGPDSRGPDIDPTVPPSGTGCQECLASDGWWVHLRRCAACGHVGCCDSSPSQHSSKHYAASDHPIMVSFEPGEEWAWNFATGTACPAPQLADPQSRPLDQPAPGPAGAVPADWQSKIH